MSLAYALPAWLVVTWALAGCDRIDQSQVQAAPAATLLNESPVAGVGPAFPPLTGRVVDQANILRPEEEGRLTETLDALERRTTDQLVIVTIPSLEGRPIEDFSRELGNHWGIGRANNSNGVLLVVAPQERRVRIAVGYGLEPILTNARAAEIIDGDLLPAFRQARWNDGISAGVDAIAKTLIANAGTPRRGRQ